MIFLRTRLPHEYTQLTVHKIQGATENKSVVVNQLHAGDCYISPAKRNRDLENGPKGSHIPETPSCKRNVIGFNE